MARATTKSDLIADATTQFEKMWNLIDSMTMEEQTAAFQYSDTFNKKEAHWDRDKNLRDVLIHLYEWHQLLLHWVEANRKGETKPFLLAPYNWKTYGQMNVSFWEKHQSTSYEDSKKMLLESHNQVLEMIKAFSNEELFEKGHFDWVGSNAVGAYCVSTTSSHYDWAIKKIKQHIKTCKGK
ncbi:ClbS/DfsB family four-helix bundle protein [Clostridium merdae]|uniref:ClbS/DfsB family four-helix bundle protein n=1 Tax=Clostridium merdae TaxID=1958780 RepID=UPI000A26E235|nr:ClbS/DfsB family four-helix bundle protein [Clostridium merdae]